MGRVAPAYPVLFPGCLFTDPFEYLAKARFFKLIQQSYDGAGEDFFERSVDSQGRSSADIGRMQKRPSLDCLINICQIDSFGDFSSLEPPVGPFWLSISF